MAGRQPIADPEDGRKRCAWAATDLMLAGYHDCEWGRPIRTDAGHLDRLALEILQCGLSWKIVLVKRAVLRLAFEGFEPARVAKFTGRDVRRLCADAAIIRNRRKIEATIINAQRFTEIAGRYGSYRRWFLLLPARTPRQREAWHRQFWETFRFMGPGTTKCCLMGVGKIPAEHEPGCRLAG